MSFATLGLSNILLQPLIRLGYHKPTAVQTRAIPLVLSGRDLIARAQTGTGKTAAFGLPMIDRLLLHERQPRLARAPRGLVLVPTRELAVQVHQALLQYGTPAQLRCAVVVGGAGMRAQQEALRSGVDIVVATPGRLIDHMEQRSIDLRQVEVLTLDEADRMLDMGFLPALRRIILATPRARQTLLFSATMPREITQLAMQFSREPLQVDVSENRTVPSTVTHRVHSVDQGGKPDALTRVLREAPSGQALVFCKTKRRSDRVGTQLTRAGIRTAVIHGNKSQNARTRALSDFKAGRVNVLVATDIAARGLDIAQLPLVVNYDLPLVAEDYVHRVGRTGRAGQTGRAVSLVSAEDRGLLRAIQRALPSLIQEERTADQI